MRRLVNWKSGKKSDHVLIAKNSTSRYNNLKIGLELFLKVQDVDNAWVAPISTHFWKSLIRFSESLAVYLSYVSCDKSHTAGENFYVFWAFF